MVRKFLHNIVDIIIDAIVDDNDCNTRHTLMLTFLALLFAIVVFVAYVNSQDKSGKKKGEKKGSNNDSNINVCEDCDKNKKTSGNIAKKDSDSEDKFEKKEEEQKNNNDSNKNWDKNKKAPDNIAKKNEDFNFLKKGGYTHAIPLSPELAAVVGAKQMARHEVMKKVRSIIEERNLYDPKAKQFAICDEELIKVMGVKRFRIFSMMKYLKNHFLD